MAGAPDRDGAGSRRWRPAMTMRWSEQWFPNGEWILALALAAEILVFSAIAQNFFTARRTSSRSPRLSVELGLLAVALTPVIVSRRHRPVGRLDDGPGGGAASARRRATGIWLPLAPRRVALAAGCAGGALNALLDRAAASFPPLIVTLGSLLAVPRHRRRDHPGRRQLHRISPPRSSFSGQGYLGGVIPAQLPVFVAVVAAYVVLLHRSVDRPRAVRDRLHGRRARATPAIPVARRVGARLRAVGAGGERGGDHLRRPPRPGQADAGTGYELDAITAVVLGGTSVFGGRGTLCGTLLGLFALTVLQNGLQLAALPSELAGVLTGVAARRPRLPSIAQPPARRRAAPAFGGGA